MFHTVLCDLLDIELPILMGAMQGAGKPKLVAAVSEAGGLGVLPTYGEREEDLIRQINETRAMTAKPFGVNITPLGAKFTERRAAICIDMGVPVVTTGLGDPGPRAVGDLRKTGIKVIPVVPTVRHALGLRLRARMRLWLQGLKRAVMSAASRRCRWCRWLWMP